MNEFKNQNSDQQFRNSFARLLKWDPLDRVLMMGTDQSDLFLPNLQTFIDQSIPDKKGHVFDYGCGDGQTFDGLTVV